MANIEAVDYDEIAASAKKIRSHGENINKFMVSAYTDVENMRKDWYGQRYNTIVDKFNNISASVNQMLNLIVAELPSEMEKIANNYSQANTSTNVTTVQNTVPKKVPTVTRSTEEGMRFITANVNDAKQRIEKQFNDAVLEMDSISTIFNEITWSSEAATNFREVFNTLKSNISESFNSIRVMFNKLVKEAISDVESAENANNVG